MTARTNWSNAMRDATLPMLILLALAGCGERPSIAPAAGVITLDGKPLAGATITTQPIATTSRNPGRVRLDVPTRMAVLSWNS